MDRLQAALRRYQQLLPEAPAPQSVGSKELQVWLREYLVPVLEEFVGRPSFRKHATWPQRTLRPGAETPERVAVDRVRDALRSMAKVLLKANRSLSNQPISSDEPVANRHTGSIADSATAADAGIAWGHIGEIVQLPQDFLVNMGDYFEPTQVFVEGEGGARLQRAEMIVSVNSELLVIGNFVVRCLLRRIGDCLSSLELGARECLHRLPTRTRKLRLEVTTSRAALRDAIRELQHLLAPTGELLLVDSCVTGVQLYAALSSQPVLDWLDVDERLIQQGADALRARLQGLRGPVLWERIAAALSSLKGLNNSRDPQQSALEEAISLGGLVIDRDAGEAYWDRQKLTNVSGKTFDFLSALARKVSTRSAVDVSDVYSEPVTDSALSSARNRLKNAVPADLNHLVVEGTARSTYRLNLDAERVTVLGSPRRR